MSDNRPSNNKPAESQQKLPDGADPQNIRPYGDTMDDGQVQVSFSLPVPMGPEAREAARRLAGQMGLKEPQVYHEVDMGHGFSYFIIYGKCVHSVDYSRIVVPKLDVEIMGFHEIEHYMEEHFDRRIRLVGACTGSDAHTVGIDAIMDMKGYNGEYGLERYSTFETVNMGSQIPNDVLLAKIIDFKADAVLVSQVVTQRDVHLTNLAELVDMVEAEGIRQNVLLICGGPRISHEVALELGFDAGFGPGTKPNHVAGFIAQELVKRSAANRHA